jgi:hypothetical protein
MRESSCVPDGRRASGGSHGSFLTTQSGGTQVSMPLVGLPDPGEVGPLASADHRGASEGLGAM